MRGDLTFVSAHAFAETRHMLPRAADERSCSIGFETWSGIKSSNSDEGLQRVIIQSLASEPARRWLEAIFGNSPFLTRLVLRDPAIAIETMADGPDISFAQVLDRLNTDDARLTRAQLIRALRLAKRHAALIVAMADLAGLWPLEKVTAALSALAEAALTQALRHLLRAAAARGDLRLRSEAEPEQGSGIIVLGMGKLGARELNYSSDIDIIVLFDPDAGIAASSDELQSLMSRLTRDLVTIMEERTSDGYVFRTDLRLRPDPASTPPAVSVAAAEIYYGSLGQNWERAAMIKARPVAGDLAAGDAFLRVLRPFIWRKNLDFAAIRDILSIKRQIEARHNQPIADIAGYNVKLGHGGIREIEFFAQTQQLIWGGRIPGLRLRGTVETLRALVEAKRLDAQAAEDLIAAYRYLRQVEHRLQMIEDQQTHSLPKDNAALDRFAIFMGNKDAGELSGILTANLTMVRRHFAELFGEAPQLSAEGNLVFTGTESDPETLLTLGRLGFTEAETIASAVRGWHHGRIRATRSQRARELLTELVPHILRELGGTGVPDFAFRHFDRFLTQLPAGVQIFSLFRANPDLLSLVAAIMGEAPGLAAQLSRNPTLLDSVLSGDFFAAFDTGATGHLDSLRSDLDGILGQARDYQDILDLCRRWAADQRFRVGTHLLLAKIDAEIAGVLLSAIAETVIAALLPRVGDYLAASHGRVPGGRFAVIALGKLGSREMTALSDLDLIFVYDAPPEAEISSGEKPLAVSAYYARLGQRLINALTAPTAEGLLYDVDMRLRPSGNAGPLASSLAAFERYHRESAWTWEHMALSRARVIAGDTVLTGEVDAAILSVLTAPRDPEKLLRDVAEMRERITKAHPRIKPWDVKHREGGLVDIEFIAQYLQLRQASAHAEVLDVRTTVVLSKLAAAGDLDSAASAELRQSLQLWHRIQGLQRVVFAADQDEESARPLLDRILTRATGCEDSETRNAMIAEAGAAARSHYNKIIAGPAALLPKAEAGAPVPSPPI